MCLQQMLQTLSSLSAGAGVAGGAAVGGSPCQGGASMPMPQPMPMPMPMPMPQPMPYPEVIMEPASCGGTYPCKDKGSKGKKHHDKKEKKLDRKAKND